MNKLFDGIKVETSDALSEAIVRYNTIKADQILDKATDKSITVNDKVVIDLETLKGILEETLINTTKRDRI